jgi:hypothetical protein
MAIEKINLQFPKNYQSYNFGDGAVTPVEMTAIVSAKVDECVDKVNGVEQSAIEAEQIVRDMNDVVQQNITHANDILSQMETDQSELKTNLTNDYETFKTNLNTEKTNFNTQLEQEISDFKAAINTDKNTFNQNANAELTIIKDQFTTDFNTFKTDMETEKSAFNNDAQAVLTNFNQTVLNDVNTKIETMHTDGSLSEIINNELLTSIDNDIDTIKNDISNIKLSGLGLYVNIESFGAVSDGISDIKAAFYSAMDSVENAGGGTIVVPAGLWLSSRFAFWSRENITLELSPGAILQIIDDLTEVNEPFIKFDGNSTDGFTRNCHIVGYGAIIKRNRTTLDYTDSEYRHGITFGYCQDCSVKGFSIEDTGGDGIYLRSVTGIEGYPINPLIQDIQAKNNRRQGLSIISGKGIRIINFKSLNTNGTPPGAGIDIEPNIDCYIYDVNIVNLDTVANAGPSLQIYLANEPTDHKMSFNINGIRSNGDYKTLIIKRCLDRTQPLSININGLQGVNNPSNGIELNEIGSNVFIKIEGQLSGCGATALYFGSNSDNALKLIGSPMIDIDLQLNNCPSGSISYISTTYTEVMSKNTSILFRNKGTAINSAMSDNFIGDLKQVDPFFNDKHGSSAYVITPTDTVQGNRIVCNPGNAVISNYDLDDTRFKPGHKATFEIQVNYGMSISPTGGGKIYPFGSTEIKGTLKYSKITLLKLSDNNWKVIEYIGDWMTV